MRRIAIGIGLRIIPLGRRPFVRLPGIPDREKSPSRLRGTEAALAGIQVGSLKVQQLPVFVSPDLVVSAYGVLSRSHLERIDEIPPDAVFIDFFGRETHLGQGAAGVQNLALGRQNVGFDVLAIGRAVGNMPDGLTDGHLTPLFAVVSGDDGGRVAVEVLHEDHAQILVFEDDIVLGVDPRCSFLGRLGRYGRQGRVDHIVDGDRLGNRHTVTSNSDLHPARRGFSRLDLPGKPAVGADLQCRAGQRGAALHKFQTWR